jgi:hypothetical protein
MPRDDDPTPQKAHPSGEYPAWVGLLFQQTDRIEHHIAKCRDEIASQSTKLVEHIGEDKVMRSQLDALLKDKGQQEAESRSMTTGAKLAVLAAILGPVIMVAFELLRSNH